MYRLVIVESAERELKRLDRSIAQRVRDRVRWLAENVEQIEPRVLTADLAGFFKLRVGDYRVLYKARRDEQTIVIHAIEHRRQVYKKK
ncbi:MAG: type II toxin-antitoxin system RelE/ParE family toxin [Chloroflexi bacterium]|nr:type II toxin-antitoxin system RelE/ParE family toxin [Chloroflexota bacterium]